LLAGALLRQLAPGVAGHRNEAPSHPRRSRTIPRTIMIR
jgi:hypothetical protein